MFVLFKLFRIRGTESSICVQETDVRVQRITDDTCSLRSCSLERLKFEVTCCTLAVTSFFLSGHYVGEGGDNIGLLCVK